MTSRSPLNVTRLVLFLLPAITLAYIAIATPWEVAVVALLLVGVLFTLLRPFTVSVKALAWVSVIYLIIGGLLNFAQPIVTDSGWIFSVIVLLSLWLQPFIFICIIDSVLGLLQKNRQVSDMAAVVGLWVSTLAVAFGSTALWHGINDSAANLFTLFIVPWLVNGFAFFIAIFVLIINHISGRKTTKKSKKRKKS